MKPRALRVFQCSLIVLAFSIRPETPHALPAATPASLAKPPRASLPEDLLSYFRGEWRGKGKFASSGKDLESDYSFVPDLENQCLVLRQHEKPPNTFQFIALWGMDSGSRQLVMLLVSNHDSGARLFRSDGWQAGRLVFQSTPELRSCFALERFTFERRSGDVFQASYEMSADSGKTWKIGDRQVFTKVSP